MLKGLSGKEKRKWALVLSGGGGRGIAFVGAIKKLESMGLRPDLVVGTSIGAIIGGIYACGTPLEELETTLLNDFNIAQYLEGFTYGLNKGPLFKVLQAGEVINTALTKPGIDGGSKIRKVLKKLTYSYQFKDTQIPFVCNATNLYTGLEVLQDSGFLYEAIYASMAYPGVFTPWEKGKLLLADGVISNNLPTWVPQAYGIHKSIALNVGGLDPLDYKKTNALELFFRSFVCSTENLVSRRNVKANLELTIKSEISSFNFSQGRKLITLGERIIQDHRDEIIKLLLR